MTFREALRRHLEAIERRDLGALAGGGWFAMDNWTLECQPVELFESGDLGVAVLRLDYREAPAKRQESFLTLVFQRRDGRWLMVHDQNTPVR